MEKIYEVLPLRPAMVRELMEELLDVDKAVARAMLRGEIERGYMSLGWDGKLHKGKV